jgi:nucleotide-binding universal stress UspA family protein
MIKILVPIDFSASSKKAMEYAILIGSKIKARIEPLHVAVAPLKSGTKLRKKFQELSKEEDRLEVNRKMSKFLKGLNSKKVTLSDPLIRYGDVAKQIINVSIQEDIDFVVMGTKGANKLKEAFIGSNAYSTLKMSVVPTIIVPEKYEIEKNKSACIALKIEKFHTTIGGQLIELSKKLGYEPEMLTVVEDWDDRIGMDIKFDEKKYPLHIYRSTKAIDIVSQHIKKNNSALLGLHFNLYSFIKGLTTPVVSKEFTFRSPIPILFIK